MRFLSRDATEDVETVTTIAKQIAKVWDEGGGTDFGFRLIYFPETIEFCSNKAEQVILPELLSDSPGPFKRVAALTVFAKLFNIFGLARPNYVDGNPFEPALLGDTAYNQWLARVSALFIPATLAVLQLEVPADNPNTPPTILPLDATFDYPSAHYKLEVLLFLEWLDEQSFPDINDEWDEETIARISRIILALALIIEASYYFSETRPHPRNPYHIRGKCKGIHQADLTGVNYDKHILHNWHKKP